MCFLDEDFIARVKNVASVSHPLHTSRLAMLRYIIHACMAWAGEGSTVWGGSEKGRFDWIIGSSKMLVFCCFVFAFFVMQLRLNADPAQVHMVLKI